MHTCIFLCLCMCSHKSEPGFTIFPLLQYQALPDNYFRESCRFPKRLSLQCEYLLVGSVGGRFRTQQQPGRWKRITLCGRYLCFSFTGMIRDSSVFPSELHRGAKCGCCRSQKKKLSPSSSKKEKISKPSDKTSSTTASSATMFLVGMICTQTSAHWHLKIPIKWYRSIYFISF